MSDDEPPRWVDAPFGLDNEDWAAIRFVETMQKASPRYRQDRADKFMPRPRARMGYEPFFEVLNEVGLATYPEDWVCLPMPLMAEARRLRSAGKWLLNDMEVDFVPREFPFLYSTVVRCTFSGTSTLEKIWGAAGSFNNVTHTALTRYQDVFSDLMDSVLGSEVDLSWRYVAGGPLEPFDKFTLNTETPSILTFGGLVTPSGQATYFERLYDQIEDTVYLVISDRWRSRFRDGRFSVGGVSSNASATPDPSPVRVGPLGAISDATLKSWATDFSTKNGRKPTREEAVAAHRGRYSVESIGRAYTKLPAEVRRQRGESVRRG
jgi:hypothetical protein